jgi:hypothetical protein
VQERFFRFHVDARCRINQDENRRAARERSPHHDFLLVAPGEIGNELIRPVRDHPKRLDGLVCGCGAARRRNESKRSKRVRYGHRDVVGDRLRENESLAMPAFRHVADAERERRRNIARAQRSAINPDCPRRVWPQPSNDLSYAEAAAAGRAAKPDASAKLKLTCSPVIASMSASLGKVAAGAVRMCFASRSTVTVWQTS